MKNELFLTPHDAGKVLEVSSDTVRKLEKNGKIKAIRTSGGSRLFRESDVLKLRDERLANPPRPFGRQA